MKRLVSLAAVLLLACGTAHADETAFAPGPTLELEHLDLLPIGEFEREALRAAHPDLSKRLQSLAARIRGLEKKLAGLARQDDDESRKLRADLVRLRAEADAPLAELRDELLPHGLTDGMLVQMAAAPPARGAWSATATSWSSCSRGSIPASARSSSAWCPRSTARTWRPRR